MASRQGPAGGGGGKILWKKSLRWREILVAAPPSLKKGSTLELSKLLPPTASRSIVLRL